MTGLRDGSDAFALLDLPPRYALDAATLEERFFARSRELHPDKFVTAPAAQRVAALSSARALNDAYQVLRKPAARAEHLLARRGVVIGANERLDPAFLQEILELREELSTARAAGALGRVTELARAMQRRRAAVLEGLGPAFAEVEGSAQAEPAALARIKQALISLRYLDRYLEECDAALDDET